MTRRETIEEAKKSLNEMREKLGTRAAVVVLGTKQDLANLREISKQDLAEFAKTQRAEFREVSAYSGLNVREAGRLMLSQITDMIVELNGFIPFEHAPRRQKALKDNNR